MIREVAVAEGVVRPHREGDPSPLAWVEKPTLRLAPGEREKFAREARDLLRRGIAE